MAENKILSETVKTIIKTLDMDWKEVLWQQPQSGLWLMYHRYVELAGAKANIVYDYDPVEFNTEKKIAVVKCTAKLNGKTMVTFGEASPFNNKNNYPVSMAEKRAYDRAVLKLLGLHGHVYSDQEVE